MAIIYENEIITKKEELATYIGQLNDDVAALNSYINKISETVEGLKVCLNTTGGVERIKNISSINFDTKPLSIVSQDTNEIEVYYQKKRVDVNRLF